MDNKRLAELLFSHVTKTPEDYEKEYPKRNLKEGAKVTRFAPSPTGFLHIGGLFAAFVSERAARKTDGIFFLRIEDTDKKREVENGVTGIVRGLQNFGIKIDEGMLTETDSIGDYGPYTQSRRKDIYQAFAKSLVEKGLAYPCFCTSEKLDEIRKSQEEKKQNPGYYGEFAKCRDLSYEEIEKNINAGMPYVLRLKSPGSEEKRIKFDDAIKGEIEMPENVQDIVILKTDGIPTYHFAHAIDDHLMGTTDVIRGDEWISSAPVHLQLFELLGFKAPRYAHISPIMKEDEETGGKRKLSKRKDPEAAVTYYHEVGYPKEAVLEYLLTIANSNYEEWRMANPDLSSDEFDFSLKNMSKAGALFDLVKLNDISKNYICKLDKETVFERTLLWAEEFDESFADKLKENKEYSVRIFGIERGNEKPRKDIAKWQDAVLYTKYFFERPIEYEWAENISNADVVEILNTYKGVYKAEETADEWFPKVRDMAESLGYAKAPKAYKKDPDAFKGHVGDVASAIRVAVTGRRNTPDLYEILQTLGYSEVMERIDTAIEKLR